MISPDNTATEAGNTSNATEGGNGAAGAKDVPAIPLGQATNALFKFDFRTDTQRDDEGKEIGKGRKHPTVKGPLPIPTYTQLGEYLAEGGKEAALILEAVINMIDTAARGQINEFRETQGLDKDFQLTNFDLNKLTLTGIANTPRGERGGPAISDADWTAFLMDYAQVMTGVVGYDANKVKLHVVHLKVQFRRIKNDKPIVKKMMDFLATWAAKTESLDDHAACYEDLVRRGEKYLKAEEKDLLSAL